MVLARWRLWKEDTIYHEGDVVAFAGATYQATKDTARAPNAKDWICLASPGNSPVVRGTYDSDVEYRHLDVVMVGGSSFNARSRHYLGTSRQSRKSLQFAPLPSSSRESRSRAKEGMMEYSFHCDQRRVAYTNAGITPQTIHLSVQENCGGNSRVTVFDSHHNVVGPPKVFPSPGSTVTLSIDPNQEVEVFCDGGNDPHGCKFEVVFR